MKTLLVFGARPNFMKVAPLYRAMTACDAFDAVLVHTGQHFDRAMSEEFLEVLDSRHPTGISASAPARKPSRWPRSCGASKGSWPRCAPTSPSWWATSPPPWPQP